MVYSGIVAINHRQNPRAKVLFAVGLLIDVIALWRGVLFYRALPDGENAKES